MTAVIQSNYYVGNGQPYATVNQVLNTLKQAFDSGNYQLPSMSSLNDGDINIVLVGNKTFAPIKFPDNLTEELANNGRYLVIKRQEYQASGSLITDSIPIISPMAQDGSEIDISDKLIGINIGSNNPNVKIIGLKVSGFLIGLSCGSNSNNLYILRSFFTNSYNAQIYASNIEGLYLINNIIVGGQYGIVAKYIKKLRAYHNTIIVDGLSALDNKPKAGTILQGERQLQNTSPSSIYFLGNIVYTIGCPGSIFYEEDLKKNRLVSDYNNYYSADTLVQLRQDNATLSSDASEVIKFNYKKLDDWKRAGPLGASTTYDIDTNSIAVHPQFIQNFSLLGNTKSSIINLGTINNSPLTQKVPSWYYESSAFYIPSDFDDELISTDCLLAARQFPFTSIGANDSPSINGFFGHDIFTSPLVLDPEKKCDLDPINVLSSQEIVMSYPSIKAGLFWSHDRPYYLYGKKFAGNLGSIARTKFNLPGKLDPTSAKVYIREVLIPNTDWNLIGKDIYIYHKNHGISSYSDEIQIEGRIKRWANNGFAFENTYYVYKISDGTTEFILPKDYQPNAPVVVTDDRISYLNPSDATRAEFSVEYNFDANENVITFAGSNNLFDNSDFTYFTTGSTPLGWVSTIDNGSSGVFILGPQYAYFGDHAVALKVDGTQGSITSNKIPISENDSFNITWHARTPAGITGQNRVSVPNVTGYYLVNFYDNYDELMPYNIGGYFVSNTGTFTRFYLPLGSSDEIVDTNLESLDSAPLSYVSTTPVNIPANANSLTFTLSGANLSSNVTIGSFIIVDALQAEYKISPSYYKPKPDFNGMTIEFETDPSGLFIDTRMNISSTVNENPNGFLAIQDMPAYLWGGPQNPEVTTLHEYRWQYGRINVLPWSRLFGKDKLKEKVTLSNKPAYLRDVIVPFVHPKGAAEAIITPGKLVCNQDSEDPEYFHIQVLDTNGNPYSLRNYVAHVYEAGAKFPGWLAKRYYGAKEQLGTTIFGKLNSNGGMTASYVSPSSRHISWIGNVPYPTSGANGNISSIRTSFVCSLENNGSITIIGQSGNFHKVNAVLDITGIYTSTANENKSYVSLSYPPVFGSVSVSLDGEPFKETIGIPQTSEFSVDYLSAKIILPIEVSAGVDFDISYRPRYAYPDYQDKNRIILHNDYLFSGYSGVIQVDYDAEVNIELRVSDPLDREFVATFPIVLQNPQLGYIPENISTFEF